MCTRCAQCDCRVTPVYKASCVKCARMCAPWKVHRMCTRDGSGARQKHPTRRARAGARNSEPGTRNPEPETRNSELGTGNPEQGTRNSELGTRNWEPGTGNPELGTRNSELGTRNTEPGTRNPEHGTRKTEQGTRNTEPGTRNSELGTRNTELGRRNREHGTGNTGPLGPGRALMPLRGWEASRRPGGGCSEPGRRAPCGVTADRCRRRLLRPRLRPCRFARRVRRRR